MSDHADRVDEATARVLAHHEILMASPAATKLNSFYPNPSESECTIAQAVCNSGQLFIQANSKQIGGSSDFMVSTPNIMDCPQLLMSFTMKAIPDPIEEVPGVNDQRKRMYYCTYHDGWGFDAIDRLEVSFANSNISNLQIQGHAMRDWSLLQCKNADEREQMLKIAGKGKTFTRDKDVTLEACIPLSFLFFRSAGGVKGGFGIDGRVLNGPITFQFHFKQIQYFCGPAASNYNRGITPTLYDRASTDASFLPAVVRGASFPSSSLPGGLLPTSFDRLELTMRTYQLMDGTFSVSKALESDPSLIYSIPSLWMNTYTQDVTLDNNGRGSLNINSVPAGMIQAIIIRARPVNPTAYHNNYFVPEHTDIDADFVGDYQSKLNYDPPVYNDNVIRPVASQVIGDGANQQTGVTPAYRPYIPWSPPFDEIRLQYSGQAIYYTKTSESHDGFTRSIFNDDLKTKVCGLPLSLSVTGQERVMRSQPRDDITTWSQSNTVTLSNLGDGAMVNHDTQTMVIPLMHDGDGLFRHRAFENLPHYSGSTLQLDFKMKKCNNYSANGLSRVQCRQDTGQQFLYNDPSDLENVTGADRFDSDVNHATWVPEKTAASCESFPSNRTQHVASAAHPQKYNTTFGTVDGAPFAQNNRERVLFNNNPTADGAGVYDATGGLVRVDLTYVVAALFQVTNGVAELQL